MKTLLASSLVVLSALLPQACVHADEGPVKDVAQALITEERSASYVGGPARESPSGTAAAQQQSAAEMVDATTARHHSSARAKSAAGKTARGTVSMSPRAVDFYFFDAGSRLITDRDGDAYHSELRIRFDADSNIGDALVYARLYLRRAGERDWWLYHETDDFRIFGQSSEDDYFVTTTLDDGFPTAGYDVLVDLYEVGFSDIVATIGPADTSALSLLPLEEAGLDVPIQLRGYGIREVTTQLLIDEDGDGHYSRFRITFDPDADAGTNWLYARVWVRARGGQWVEEHVSSDFPVYASGTDDLYQLTVDWLRGYPTSFYDVQIDLYESASDLLVASAGSERPELALIPLEDQARDVRPNPPSEGGGGSSTSREGGGGALGAWWVFAFGLIAAGRAKGRGVKARRTASTGPAGGRLRSRAGTRVRAFRAPAPRPV